MSQPSRTNSGSPQTGGKVVEPKAREKDALYQSGRIVARVIDPEVDLDGKELRFGEIYNSDELMIPEECEYQGYRILIQRIAYASKIEKGEAHKGRVLRGVSANLLGFREP